MKYKGRPASGPPFYCAYCIFCTAIKISHKMTIFFINSALFNYHRLGIFLLCCFFFFASLASLPSLSLPPMCQNEHCWHRYTVFLTECCRILVIASALFLKRTFSAQIETVYGAGLSLFLQSPVPCGSRN